VRAGGAAAAARRRRHARWPRARFLARRLKDVEHSDGRLYLVFEWLEKDLRKYMDGIGGMEMPLVKVRAARGGCARGGAR
jgi:hypothetical protein